jgi:hypothetical protein
LVATKAVAWLGTASFGWGDRTVSRGYGAMRVQSCREGYGFELCVSQSDDLRVGYRTDSSDVVLKAVAWAWNSNFF